MGAKVVQMEIDFGEKYEKVVDKEHERIETSLLKIFANLSLRIDTVNQIMRLIKEDLS